MKTFKHVRSILVIVFGLTSTAGLSDGVTYHVEAGPFSPDEASTICRKKGAGWGTVAADDHGPKEAKIDLPKDIFVSITEGDYMFVVVVDTKTWKNRDAKPNEKFGVLCEGVPSLSAPVSEDVYFKQIAEYNQERDSKLLERADKFFSAVKGKSCQRAVILAGYDNTFSRFDGIHCLPVKFWKQAMEGPKWLVVDVKTSGWSNVVNVNSEICDAAIPVYKKRAIEAVKIKMTKPPYREGVQPTVIDAAFWDRVESAAGRSCTDAEEAAWEADQRRKTDEFHFRHHKKKK